ncbi:hypothetical protein B0W81_02310 [Prochlorococcus sp. HOT_208_60]|nr:hypothetical protein B0W81_02310 [Prochlorococcus sp. HOT_208_60]
MNSLENFFKIKIEGYQKSIKNKKHLFFYGQISFVFGIIFLSSALPISIFFLLIALSISIKNTYQNFFSDKWNITLIICSALILISCWLRTYFPNQYELSYLAKNSWLDILNWIPLFLSYYGFQFYLRTSRQRIICAKALVISTIPLIYSCISQYWFKIFGPFSTLFGLITWYQKPFENAQSGVTGLFNNPNYTGYWLSTVLPFSLYFLVKSKSKKNLFFVLLINFLLILFFLLNTSSRNSLISVLLSSLLIISTKFLLLSVVTLFLILTFVKLLNPLFPIDIQEFILNIFPDKLISKLMLFKNFDLSSFHRFDVFKSAIIFISKKPLFGWGASTFGILYLSNGGLSPATHAHNLILEITYNYGIIVAFIISLFIFNLSLKSWLVIRKHKGNLIPFIDKFWVLSGISSVIFHMNDMPYYDGKISILFWLLLAGLKSIVGDYKNI